MICSCTRAIKNAAPGVAIALVAISCSRGVSRIQTLPLPGQNPTTYSFPFSATDVHARALDAFSIEHQVKQPIFGRSAVSAQLESFLSCECATNAIFAEALFRDPANANDIYLHTFHSPFVISSVYRGRNGGLPFIAAFHVHLSPSGSNTQVSVTATNTEVVNGTKFGFGSCGPGQAWNCERVKPTTVEEYRILCYLGRYLGATNMAPVILPSR